MQAGSWIRPEKGGSSPKRPLTSEYYSDIIYTTFGTLAPAALPLVPTSRRSRVEWAAHREAPERTAYNSPCAQGAFTHLEV